jgi:hypothetical protein
MQDSLTTATFNRNIFDRSVSALNDHISAVSHLPRSAPLAGPSIDLSVFQHKLTRWHCELLPLVPVTFMDLPGGGGVPANTFPNVIKVKKLK